ncbi:MAG: hypothetical protein EZS28_010528 [Streblomastix strix]|uniref:Uncharacterized protein n=1 Tax=Streblomastix strix TaxID=222440 RepID=A0A5J4WHV4_9EUKA|nr:MAG: hypothetical protein EZS28_010528 [Streblomastix strix]
MLIQKYHINKLDLSAQSELVVDEYARTIMLLVGTAGGNGEQDDDDIYYSLDCISKFSRDLHQGRYNKYGIFQPQPALSKTCIEQIEEEGGNEEVESQLINKGNWGYIIYGTNQVKSEILNLYIAKSNRRLLQFL